MYTADSEGLCNGRGNPAPASPFLPPQISEFASYNMTRGGHMPHCNDVARYCVVGGRQVGSAPIPLNPRLVRL
jgi:hypothetical protein